jgi:hypothetical protein
MVALVERWKVQYSRIDGWPGYTQNATSFNDFTEVSLIVHILRQCFKSIKSRYW